jgi:hypothetical protein
VRYRLDQDGTDVVTGTQRTVAMGGKPIAVGRTMNHRTLMDQIPGVRNVLTAIQVPGGKGGHANQRTLSPYGQMLLEEMMARGMLIDIDHMSQKTLDAALDLAEAHSYPVLSSHSWFRELAYTANVQFNPLDENPYGTSDVHKVAHENGKRPDQVERIAKLGGVIAPIWNQGDIAGLCVGAPELTDKIPAPCAGSSTAWAQAYLYVLKKMGGRGVALGSDINGAAGLPGPRFGTRAAYGAHDDQCRAAQRRGEIDRQTNGVRYDTPLRDYRWARFDPSGEGGYSEREREVWQAVAAYKAGFNPETTPHPADDAPPPGIRMAFEADQWPWVRERIDNMTIGLWNADDPSWEREQIREWPREQRAAYLARKGAVEPSRGWDLNEELLDLVDEIKDILDRWDAMGGGNPPLVRCTAGPRHDFDINLDGVAHFGMLPDFLQDMRNVGLTPEDLAPLFRSAHDYIEMWGACEQTSGVRIESQTSNVNSLASCSLLLTFDY